MCLASIIFPRILIVSAASAEQEDKPSMTEPETTQCVPTGVSASALSLFLGLLMILMAGCTHRAVTTVEEVDAMVKARVPIGSDREKVNSFIDDLKVGSLKIERDPLRSSEPDLKYASTSRDREKLEELGARIAECGAVVISDAETGFPHYYAAIVIRFFVDREGKLIDYTVRKEETE